MSQEQARCEPSSRTEESTGENRTSTPDAGVRLPGFDLSLLGCVTLGKMPNLSVLQCSHLSNEDNYRNYHLPTYPAPNLLQNKSPLSPLLPGMLPAPRPPVILAHS